MESEMEVLREKIAGFFGVFESDAAVDLDTWKNEIFDLVNEADRGFAELEELRNLNSALNIDNRKLRKVLVDEHRIRISLLGEPEADSKAAELMEADVDTLIDKRLDVLDTLDRTFVLQSKNGGINSQEDSHRVYRNIGIFTA